jgi:hypothetical protein
MNAGGGTPVPGGEGGTPLLDTAGVRVKGVGRAVEEVKEMYKVSLSEARGRE